MPSRQHAEHTLIRVVGLVVPEFLTAHHYASTVRLHLVRVERVTGAYGCAILQHDLKRGRAGSSIRQSYHQLRCPRYPSFVRSHLVPITIHLQGSRVSNATSRSKRGGIPALDMLWGACCQVLKPPSTACIHCPALGGPVLSRKNSSPTPPQKKAACGGRGSGTQLFPGTPRSPRSSPLVLRSIPVEVRGESTDDSRSVLDG